MDIRGIQHTDNIRERPNTRPIPIAPFSVATGAAQSVFTSPERQTSTLAGLVASNGTAGALTLTLHVGATSGAVAIDAVTVPANGVLDLSGLLMIGAGETLWATASASGIKLSGWATAYL